MTQSHQNGKSKVKMSLFPASFFRPGKFGARNRRLPTVRTALSANTSRGSSGASRSAAKGNRAVVQARAGGGFIGVLAQVDERVVLAGAADKGVKPRGGATGHSRKHRVLAGTVSPQPPIELEVAEMIRGQRVEAGDTPIVGATHMGLASSPHRSLRPTGLGVKPERCI